MKKVLIFFLVMAFLLVSCGNSENKYTATVYIDIVNNTGYDDILGRDVSSVESVIKIDGKKIATLNVGDKAAISIELSKGNHKLKIGLKEISFEVTDTTTNVFNYKYLCNLLSYELQATTEQVVVDDADWIYVD